jgi:hypothetical protein
LSRRRAIIDLYVDLVMVFVIVLVLLVAGLSILASHAGVVG